MEKSKEKEKDETKATDGGDGDGAATFDFMTAVDIAVPLTYLFFTPAAQVCFYCKIVMTETEKEIRQKHFGKPDDERAATRHAYNVEMLSKISTKPPTGFVNFPNNFADPLQPSIMELQNAILNYFREPIPMNVRVCDDALNYYTTILQPAEFFR